MILWGVVNLARDVLITLAPAWFGPRWFSIDAIGIIGTLALLRWVVGSPGRALSACQNAGGVLSLLSPSAGSGRISLAGSVRAAKQIGVLGRRCSCSAGALAGLWFGAAFSAIGLGLTALILVAYVWSGAAFPLWLAAVSGGGFVLCGLWMRRA